jgi:hypothetical protein
VDNKDTELIKRLVNRLEHLSADSSYAHRASGLRGSLLRYIERIEAGQYIDQEEQVQISQAMEYGFKILELAAKEVGGAR